MGTASFVAPDIHQTAIHHSSFLIPHSSTKPSFAAPDIHQTAIPHSSFLIPHSSTKPSFAAPDIHQSTNPPNRQIPAPAAQYTIAGSTVPGHTSNQIHAGSIWFDPAYGPAYGPAHGSPSAASQIRWCSLAAVYAYGPQESTGAGYEHRHVAMT